ncbi:hypothetical protein P3T36_007288 [Kitasatospora sp. MAP12-15]|uniref:hypothetical protein n=1 Tax=unclassified Kitasatospora TaxID=2633591 RepID=UPI0024756E45|nr:hypothetical protein [Kitasatospora sp. MAP12-44]MDH6115671.1 hypothetical protein [Kitasatospora sp. MAP12-44]
MLLLHLALSPAGRLLALGVLCHLTAGTTYLALTGISDTRVPIHHREIGTGPAAAVAAAAVWSAVVVLWPVPLVCRTVRALRRRPDAAQLSEERIWRARPAAVVAISVPPEWYRREYEAARAARADSAAAGAARAAVLVERSVLAFGAGHSYSRDAWELLAHAARLGLAEPAPRFAALAVPRASRPLDDHAAGGDRVYLPHFPYAGA